MKQIIVLFFLLSSFFSYSQDVFTFIAGQDSITTKVQAVGKDAFITDFGYIYFDDLKRAYLHDSQIEDYYLGKFKDLKVPLIISRMEVDTMTTTILKLEENSIEEPLTARELNERLLAFNKARSTGYTLELLGVFGSAIGIATETPELAVGGGVLSLIGLITNMTAGNELIRKKDN